MNGATCKRASPTIEHAYPRATSGNLVPVLPFGQLRLQPILPQSCAHWPPTRGKVLNRSAAKPWRRSFTGFQCLMGFNNVAQCKTLGDGDTSRRPMRHDIEKIVGRFFQHRPSGNVGENGWPRDVERALLAEHAEIEGIDRPDALPKDDVQAQGLRQSSDPSKVDLPTNRRQRRICLPSVMRRPPHEVVGRVVDAVGMAVLQCQRAFFVRTGRSDGCRAQMLGPLPGDQANTTGGGMEEQRRLQPSH
jgi:hypothetical protein